MFIDCFSSFHYIDFMQTLSTKPAQENEKPSPFVYSKVSHKLEKRVSLLNICLNMHICVSFLHAFSFKSNKKLQ